VKKMKEPPIGSVLLDGFACAWQRAPYGWSICGSDGSWSYTWKELLKDLYPQDREHLQKTAIWAEATKDVGQLPRIIFVPGEELVEEEEYE